ncbi:unnamed protein product, partial [Closterium sp. NIES-54]
PAAAAESVHWPAPDHGSSFGAPRAPPKFSPGGWSRLTQALSNGRALTPSQKNWDVKRDGRRGVTGTGAARTSKAAPPKSAAASKPRSASRSPPPLVGSAETEADGEPALLLLPDGSVQIVTSHSVAESRSPKLAGDATSAANDDNGATNADHGAVGIQMEEEEHALDDVTITEEGLMASILGNTYNISETNVVTRTLSNNNPTITASKSSDSSTSTRTSSRWSAATSSAASSAASSANCSPSLLPEAPTLQPPLLSLDRRNLSPSPMPSLYRTPCACCCAKRPTTPTSHFARALTHSLTLSPTSSAATNSTFPSPMLSPTCPPSPPSPSPSVPCSAQGSSRPKAASHFYAVPEDLSFQLDSAAAQIFAAATQERSASPLMHRGWCTAGRSIHPKFSSGIGCSECDNDAGASMRSNSARYTGVKLATSTGFARVSSSGSGDSNNNNENYGMTSNRHRRSYSRGMESTEGQHGEENAFERGLVQRQHNTFRVRGRAVVTAEDMVFGHLAPSVIESRT